MRMQIGKFQLITSLAYFAAAADLLWVQISEGHGFDDGLAKYGIATVCFISGILLLLGRLFPLRLMSATLFVIGIFYLFVFSGFDESGLSNVTKAVVATMIFAVAALYQFLLKRFEAARTRKSVSDSS